MRKLICALFISLDGVTESPDQWQFAFDDEMGEAMGEQLGNQDTVLLGRKTYEEWAGYWPTSQDEPFASFINNAPKYVVSTTLSEPLEWQNSTLISGDLAAEITALKQQDGKTIGTAGSPTLVRSLLQQGLVDQLILMIHPTVAGKGSKLFEGDGELQRMKLVKGTLSSSGVAILTYEPHTADAE